ncbi:sigma-54-dependent Fis family transcriptional regulator [Paracoccus sp. (in: a-proteobacteria)]|uniref:sigma-54-dependent Fis family transcriptional regulator n=1 Tax=Paracoccus sp. TaxID=267 RepID=UPI002899D593|nr:sigma-54-dependent Fis family transcriptional regulator [Paracoccus sp. (in: a-proteobacteria)]
MSGDSHHIREIEDVSRRQERSQQRDPNLNPRDDRARGALSGAGTAALGGRDPIVIESWLRCLNLHGLDPSQRAGAHIVTDAELREHRQRAEKLVRIIRSGFEQLYAWVAGQNYVLMLSDRTGVTVEYLGDEAQKAALRKSGLYLGAEWSEARAGTCALGACLETGEALIIHQTDHFDVTHAALSCTAAPIYDTQGGLVAAVDISLLSSPQPRASQSLALNLVTQAARRMEMANIMAESRREWVLRLAGSPDFLDVDPEAALSLDGAGRIIGATHGAMRILARADALSWRRPEQIIGRPVSDFLNIRIDRLDDLTRERAAMERLIETRDGHRLYAHAIEPRPLALPRRQSGLPSPAAAALPKALLGLAGQDQHISALLARAAELASSRLPILVTGASGTGKLTLARKIHELSGRGPLLVLEAGDLGDANADAQLLGRMAARQNQPGLLSELQGGTLILRNVEDVPIRLQMRLSRLLAEGGYVPLGGLRPVPLDLRVIATSQLSSSQLEARVRAGQIGADHRPDHREDYGANQGAEIAGSGSHAGKGPRAAGDPRVSLDPRGGAALRADFYYRLCGAILALPPLCERQDLLWLAEGMINQAAGRRIEIAPELLRALSQRPWSGNLRELGFVTRRLAASAVNGALSLEAGLGILGTDPTQPRATSEAMALAQMLALSGGNISLCARRLGVDRSTIHRRMRRFGLEGAGGG